MNFSLLLGQVVTGVFAGGGYAVVAIGLSYTLGLARVMNFAFGTFYMLAGFTLSYVMARTGLGYFAAVLPILALAAVAGWAFSRVVVIPAMRISDAGVMIATLGAGVALTYVAQAFFGSGTSYIASPLAESSIKIGLATVSLQAVLALVLAPIITLLLDVFNSRTVAGRHIRAVAESPALASATGVNLPIVQTLAVTIGVILGALASVIYAPVGVMSVFMGDDVMLKAFTITALAGVGRLWGALVVSLGIGIFEALIGAFVSTAYSTAAIYMLLVATLIIRPKGIFRGH
jgi:branched-chain amino acid transport system permease protein